MTDRKDTCGNCRFFQPVSDDGSGQKWGECRIGRPSSGWEVIVAEAWCGEHEPLPEAVKAEGDTEYQKTQRLARVRAGNRACVFLESGLSGCTHCDFERVPQASQGLRLRGDRMMWGDAESFQEEGWRLWEQSRYLLDNERPKRVPLATIALIQKDAAWHYKTAREIVTPP